MENTRIVVAQWTVNRGAWILAALEQNTIPSLGPRINSACTRDLIFQISRMFILSVPDGFGIDYVLSRQT